MARRTSQILLMVACTAAGFAAARWCPVSADSLPPAKPVAPAPAPVPWLPLKDAARFAACMEHSASVSADTWPAHFATHQHDELLRPVLLEAWIQCDPAGCWRWIREQKDAALIAEAGRPLFKVWAGREVRAAFEATGEIASPHLRDPLRTVVIETELERDLAAGFALAAQCGPLSHSGGKGTAWMDQDLVAAVRGLTALSGDSGSFRYAYLGTATRRLAKQNPVAFLEWLETKPRVSANQLGAYHFREAPVADARRAIAAASGLEPGHSRDQLLMGAVTAAAGMLTPHELVETATRHLTGWERNAAIGDAAQKVARENPVKAAELLSSLPACRYLRYAAGTVAANYAKADWGAAQQWATALPDAPTRREAWTAFSSKIPPDQVEEFAAMTATLPVGELTDDLLINVRKALTARSPAQAAAWLAALPATHAAWVRAVQ